MSNSVELEKRFAETGVGFAVKIPKALEDLADGIPTDFILPEDTTVEEAVALTEGLVKMHRASRKINRRTAYAIGVTVRQSEERFGSDDFYNGFDPAKGIAYGTLRNAVYLVNSVPPEVAEVDVSEKVLYAVAPVKDKEKQLEWAKKAKENGWGGERTRREISDQAERDHATETGTEPEKTDAPEVEWVIRDCPHCYGKGKIRTQVIDHSGNDD